MNKKTIGKISIILMGLILILCIGTPVFAAEYSDVTAVEEVRSDHADAENYFSIRTPFDEENVIYVEGKSSAEIRMYCIALRKSALDDTDRDCILRVFVRPDENGCFSVKIDTTAGNEASPEVIDGKGSVVDASGSYNTIPGYQSVPEMAKGLYRLNITCAVTEEDADVSKGSEWWYGSLGGKYGFVWKNVVFSVDGNDNNPKLVRFDKVLKRNESIYLAADGAPEDISEETAGTSACYLDVALGDLGYVIEDPATMKRTVLTKDQTDYIAEVAADITAGIESDYEKLRAIFEYVASNFYYDNYSYRVGTKIQYCNPYYNLRALRTGEAVPNSAGKKVATVCDGYSAMIIALARSQGIPARMVNGVLPRGRSGTWLTQEVGENSGHWWTEAYADGRWIVMDADAASLSYWERETLEDKGTWYKSPVLNHAAFDISDEEVSVAYLLNEVEEGSADGKYICYKNEVDQLRALLETKSGEHKNGTLLNENYKKSDFSTWGHPENAKMVTNGYGRVHEILWNEKGLRGEADLSGFSALTHLSVDSNDLTVLNLDNCIELLDVSAAQNDIAVFDSADSDHLARINMQGNPLESAVFCRGESTVSITGEGGPFSFTYNALKPEPLTIYAGKAPEGTIYEGIYDSDGNKISDSREYSFVPEDTVYSVYFRDNRDERISAPAVSCDNEPWTGNIRLTWGPVEGADEYVIFRATSRDGRYSEWCTQTATAFTDVSVKTGKNYYYKVRAICRDNDVKSSVSSSPVCGMRILKCPSLYSESLEQSGKIRLTWETVTDADSYAVYRSHAENGTYEMIAETEKLKYTDSSAVPGSIYYYKVVSQNSENEEISSAPSNVVMQACRCEQPVITTAVDGNGFPILMWEKSEGAERYGIYRTSDRMAKPTWHSWTEEPYFKDVSAEIGVKYYYTVCAVFGDNYSAHSEISAVKCVNLNVPQKPQNTIIEAVESTGKPRMTWDEVEGAVRYEIWRKTAADGTFEKYFEQEAETHTNISAAAGRTYFYKVRGLDQYGGKGHFSDVMRITCHLGQPKGMKLKEVDASGKPKLAWDAVEGADAYEIWRKTGEEGSYALQHTLNSDSYTDTSAVAGTTYFYKVRATVSDNDEAASAYSEEMSATCNLPCPENPVLAASAEGKPQLSWDAVEGADEYEIWRKVGEDGTYVKRYTQSSTTYTNVSAEAGNIYYYKVRAIVSDNERAASAFTEEQFIEVS